MNESILRIFGIPDDAVIVHERIHAGTCPRCGRMFSMREPIETNALSRCTRGADDTPLYVCSPCGTYEAFQELAGVLDPPSAWVNPPPVTD